MKTCPSCNVPMEPGRRGETDDGPVQLWDCPKCGTSLQQALTTYPNISMPVCLSCGNTVWDINDQHAREGTMSCFVCKRTLQPGEWEQRELKETTDG